MQDKMTIGEAADYLGVSRTKVWTLVKEGLLTATQNPLDKRERLIPTEAVHELEGQGKKSEPRHPIPRVLYDGPVEVHSDEYEDYLREHWRPS